MSLPRLVGRNAVVKGQAYSVPKAAAAVETLLRAYLNAHPDPDANAWIVADRVRSILLRNRGFAAAHESWENISQAFDVIPQPVSFSIGQLCFRGFLHGKVNVVYDPAFGRFAGTDGRTIEGLDAPPVLCVYGPATPDGRSCLATTSAALDRVDAVLATVPQLGLSLQRHDVDIRGAVPAVGAKWAGFIEFPAAAYGAGQRELVVRCTLPNGSEIVVPDLDDEELN